MAASDGLGIQDRDDDPYRVMVVDDSAVVRGLETRMLESDPSVKVVASVGNGQLALGALERYDVEVVILDIEMPVMDGLTALPKILAKDPSVKVIMASTLTLKNAEVSMQALDLGASECLAKPTTSRDLSTGGDFKRDLLSKVKALGQARRRASVRKPLGATGASPLAAKPGSASRPLGGASGSTPAGGLSGKASSPPSPSTLSRTAALRGSTSGGAAGSAVSSSPATRSARPAATSAGHSVDGFTLTKPSSERPAIIAIGSSTGGPQALFKVLGDMRKGGWVTQPIVITQHMPATFTTILAGHINRVAGVDAKEGTDGEILEPGKVYVAPGDHHMLVESRGTEARLRINQDPPENFCRPAVDPMFRSVSKSFGRRALAVVLTGMGSDGAKGGKLLVNGGGTLVAQDEATSVVWGMPGAAAHTGACSAVLPIDEMGAQILRLANKT